MLITIRNEMAKSGFKSGTVYSMAHIVSVSLLVQGSSLLKIRTVCHTLLSWLNPENKPALFARCLLIIINGGLSRSDPAAVTLSTGSVDSAGRIHLEMEQNLAVNSLAGAEFGSE